jgi:hypothetical protein
MLGPKTVVTEVGAEPIPFGQWLDLAWQWYQQGLPERKPYRIDDIALARWCEQKPGYTLARYYGKSEEEVEKMIEEERKRHGSSLMENAPV